MWYVFRLSQYRCCSAQVLFSLPPCSRSASTFGLYKTSFHYLLFFSHQMFARHSAIILCRQVPSVFGPPCSRSSSLSIVIIITARLSCTVAATNLPSLPLMSGTNYHCKSRLLFFCEFPGSRLKTHFSAVPFATCCSAVKWLDPLPLLCFGYLLTYWFIVRLLCVLSAVHLRRSLCTRWRAWPAT